jgi:acetyl-CoA carboxylase biotin carboxyl carrier protein
MSGDDLEAPGPVEEATMSEYGLVEPVAVGPGDPGTTFGDGAAPDPGLADGAEVPDAADAIEILPAAAIAGDPADASLLALVDKLTTILERSDLGELEVAAGATTIILRSPAAIERQVALTAAPALEAGTLAVEAPAGSAATAVAAAGVPPAKPSVKAPLTGIYYGAPSPGATPYVAVGNHVAVGQIIGLIEAMKLFNEIKSDLAGRVVRVCADNGALVKARQPLIEVEPA